MPDFTLHRRAEWAPHAGSILAWPGLQGTLKDDPENLASATQEVSSIAAAIAHFERVTVLVGRERGDEAKAHFAAVETPFPVSIVQVEGASLEIWTRDFASTFVFKENGGDCSLVGLDWKFNGWGKKNASTTTETVAKTVLSHFKFERIDTTIVAEGGALETDGDGTLLVTESSILSRNPGKSREDLEKELIRVLGVEKVIWIPGKEGLDTRDRHIDSLARFARPGVVVLSKANEAKPTDWTVGYEESLEILSSATDAKGRPFEIIEVEEPDEELFESSSESASGGRPVRSYVNFLLVNGGIVLPQFGDPAHDAAAIRTAQRLFGDERRILPVLIEQLPRLGSGVHGATQEIPQFP